MVFWYIIKGHFAFSSAILSYWIGRGILNRGGNVAWGPRSSQASENSNRMKVQEIICMFPSNCSV